MNVLVIAPHPDDETLGCGGTIQAHRAAGDQVEVLTITLGDTHPDARTEWENASRILGVKPRTLHYPSPGLDQAVTLPQLATELAAYMWDTTRIYIPYTRDLHQEHGYINQACRIAARPPGPDIYQYETLSSTDFAWESFKATHYQPLTPEQLDLKLAALRCYGRQLHAQHGLRTPETVQAHNRWRGAQIRQPYAEAFNIIRTIG